MYQDGAAVRGVVWGYFGDVWSDIRPCMYTYHHHHQYDNMEEQRISTVPACSKSLPHTSFLDDHSSCIVGKYGEAMEVVHQIDGQNMSTINLSPTEAFSSDSTVISTWSRTQQSIQHSHLLPTTYSGSHSTSQEWAFASKQKTTNWLPHNITNRRP